MRTLGTQDAAWMDRRVKRSPTDFGTLLYWFKADSFPVGTPDLTPIGAAGTEWIDSAGNGFTATQGTAADRPTYRTSQFNRLPAISFDGATDFLNLGAVQTIGLGQAFTFCMVYASNSNLTDAFVLGNGGNTQFRPNVGGGDVWGIFQDGVVGPTSGGIPRTPSDLRVYWISCQTILGQRNANFYEGKLFINNSTSAQGSFTVTRISGNGAVGPGAFILNGRMGELCMWSTALTGAEIFDLAQHYFRPKWGWNFT